MSISIPQHQCYAAPSKGLPNPQSLGLVPWQGSLPWSRTRSAEGTPPARKPPGDGDKNPSEIMG